MPRAAVDGKQKVVAEFRRSEILDAAAKVFATRGFAATHMEDIAVAARLAKGTLYLYFQSKDAIYQATVRRAVTKLASLTEQRVRKESDLAGKLAAFISVRIAFWNEYQQLYRIILSINRLEQHRKRSIAWQKETVLYLQSMFADAAKAGEIPDQDFLAAAWTTIDAIRGVNERRAYSEGRSTEDDTKFLSAFILRALRTAEPVVGL
jgi:AcrR family transcriptional regulator